MPNEPYTYRDKEKISCVCCCDFCLCFIYVCLQKNSQFLGVFLSVFTIIALYIHTGIHGPEIFTNCEVKTVHRDILHQSQWNARTQGQILGTSSALGPKVLKSSHWWGYKGVIIQN